MKQLVRTNNAPLFEYVGDKLTWGRAMGNQEELTDAQINRQDFVDNAIFALLEDLAQSKTVKWDIGDIADIRDMVFEVLHDQTGVDGMEFYPYVETDDPATDALINHEVMSGEVKSDIEFPDGEFPNGNRYKGDDNE